MTPHFETFTIATGETIATFETLEDIHPAFTNCIPEFMADPWSCFTHEAYAPTPENPNGSGWPAENNWPKGVGVRAISDAPTVNQLPKSLIQERVHNLGKLGAVFAILNSQPIMFARWFAPDWPNVNADDAGLHQILKAVGLTEEQIAQVTATS